MSTPTNFAATSFGDALFDLTGRVALVTGAGQGVGAAIAETLAAHGATVAVNDLFEDRAAAVVNRLAERSLQAVPCAFDVTDRAAIDAAVARVTGEVGPVTILVNNAGVPASGFEMARFATSSTEHWMKYIQLNLLGVMHCTQAVLPAMQDLGWGRIVTITSDAGRFGEPGMAAYSASKAGSAGFTRALAKEVGRHHITANNISLGSIAGPTEDAATVQRAGSYPVGRIGLPQDIASTVLWLVSDQGEWVTAQTISVNGGYAST